MKVTNKYYSFEVEGFICQL